MCQASSPVQRSTIVLTPELYRGGETPWACSTLQGKLSDRRGGRAGGRAVVPALRVGKHWAGWGVSAALGDAPECVGLAGLGVGLTPRGWLAECVMRMNRIF